MPVTEIKTVEEFNAAIASDKPSIIDFWATWCGPCKIIRPIFKKFSEMEQFKAVTFYDVDTEIEELEDAGQKAGVTTMPSFIAFHMGERLGIARGAIPKNLEDLVKKAVAAANPESTEAVPTPSTGAAPAVSTEPTPVAPAEAKA